MYSKTIYFLLMGWVWGRMQGKYEHPLPIKAKFSHQSQVNN